MNERGQYGRRTIPLRGGSVFSRAPWGGAPDPTFYGWPYHGPRAFHGHEAPAFGRYGSWPPLREAPLGRGGLVRANDRGQYGARVAGFWSDLFKPISIPTPPEPPPEEPSHASKQGADGGVASWLRRSWKASPVDDSSKTSDASSNTNVYVALGIGAVAAAAVAVLATRRAEAT